MTPSGRSTAAALILLFALVSALLAAILVPAALRWSEDGRTIRASREREAAIRRMQASFVRIKNATDRWYLFADSPEAGFLEAPVPDDAPGVASTHVSGILVRHGGTLEKIEAIPGEAKRGQVGTIEIDLTATLPKAGLAPFLTELENTPPYTFVRSFDVKARGEDTARLVLDAQMQRLMEDPL